MTTQLRAWTQFKDTAGISNTFKEDKFLKNNLEKVLANLGKTQVGKQGMGTAEFQADIIGF